MPVLRNVNPSHQLARFGKHTPVIYDDDGWPITERINSIPNGQPLNNSISQCITSFLSSLGSLPIPQSDRQYSHYHQQELKPCISTNGRLYNSSTINASCPPSPRGNHTRRREPGHISRPRNAFIIFRSSYIQGRKSTDDGQQNELSKQAGEVWSGMTEDERDPFTHLAEVEKKTHQAMYPNYVYCPRGSARRMSSASTKKGRNTSELTPPTTSLVSSKFTTPETPAAPTLRPPRAAAQLAVQRFLQFHSISHSPPPVSPSAVTPPPEDSPMQESAYLESDPPAKMDVVIPIIGTRASEPNTPIAEDEFVPTADIPELELTPSKKEGPEHAFDLSMRPSHLDRIPEQFGFSDSIDMLAHLPPIPDLDDLASTGNVTPSSYRTPSPANSPITSVSEYLLTGFWQPTTAYLTVPQQLTSDFASYSQSSFPASLTTTPMSCNTSLDFSADDNVPDCCQQQSTNSLAAPQKPVPGFDFESDHDDPMSYTMLEDDLSFLSSFFDCNDALPMCTSPPRVLPHFTGYARY